ncbi:hypothetical protein FQA39_LY09659 [Lamprigera yunnana]|nr:hypothetical protein FQA39_LY09659 [Lamprigera yunnana]
MESKEKRVRSSNWDFAEKQLLVSVMKEHGSVIENTLSDAGTIANKKQAWQTVKEQFVQWKTIIRNGTTNTTFTRMKENSGKKKLPADEEINKISHQRPNKKIKGISAYETKSLELYKMKIEQQMTHNQELHVLRMEWEGKIYKLKYAAEKHKRNNGSTE